MNSLSMVLPFCMYFRYIMDDTFTELDCVWCFLSKDISKTFIKIYNTFVLGLREAYGGAVTFFLRRTGALAIGSLYGVNLISVLKCRRDASFPGYLEKSVVLLESKRELFIDGAVFLHVFL